MKQLIVLTLALLATFSLRAGDEDSLAALKMIDSIESAFSYQTGEIQLSNGVARLNIPQGFKFLDARQSQYVISNIWENPPDNKVLGMIFPEDAGVLTRGNYVFVITYEEDGHVKDDDAAKLDYDDLLKQIQSREVEENKERKKLGYPTLHTVAWASKPFYDKTNKRLHWARDISVATEGRQVLNYNVRILGRKGILVLNAVAEMSELQLVKNDIDKVLQIPSFTEGNKYSDYDSNIDKVAVYGIGGLIAGKVLAKAGIFAVILKFGKWILIGLVALGAGIFKFFKSKKKEEEMVYQAPSDNQPIP